MTSRKATFEPPRRSPCASPARSAYPVGRELVELRDVGPPEPGRTDDLQICLRTNLRVPPRFWAWTAGALNALTATVAPILASTCRRRPRWSVKEFTGPHPQHHDSNCQEASRHDRERDEARKLFPEECLDIALPTAAPSSESHKVASEQISQQRDTCTKDTEPADPHIPTAFYSRSSIHRGDPTG